MDNMEFGGERMNNIEVVKNRFNPISLPTSDLDSGGKNFRYS